MGDVIVKNLLGIQNGDCRAVDIASGDVYVRFVGLDEQLIAVGQISCQTSIQALQSHKADGFLGKCAVDRAENQDAQHDFLQPGCPTTTPNPSDAIINVEK